MNNTNDLIRRIDAINVVAGIDKYFVKYIEALPSAEAERKKGKWVKEVRHRKTAHDEFDYWYTYCSECGCQRRIGWFDAKYCPNCGAWMQKEGEDK